ncbi:MAG: ribbon-helix-helix domain-containing protein [Thermoproteota archaeon]
MVRIPLTGMVDNELLNRLDEYAKQIGTTKNKLVEEAIKTYLETVLRASNGYGVYVGGKLIEGKPVGDSKSNRRLPRQTPGHSGSKASSSNH